MVAEHRDDLVGLVETQQAVVDENAGQLLADRLVQQRRGDRAVDAARKRADHLGRADLLADLAYRFLAVGIHRPVAGESGFADEVLVERLPVRGVMHLGVELHGVELAGHVGGDREGRTGGGRVDLEARGDFRDVVAVAHPHLLAARAIEEPARQQVEAVFLGRHVGTAEFGGVALAGFDLAAEVVHHDLLAVADPEDRHAELVGGFGRARRALARHAVGATGEDDGLGGELLQERIGDVLIGVDFAVDIQLAQATGDELRHLASEVDDKEAIMLGHAAALGGPRPARKRLGAAQREMARRRGIGGRAFIRSG